MNRERIVELNMKEKWEKRKYWAYVCSLQQQQYTYYFHSIIKFTVHSLIYKETKCCMVWHSILLRVSFNVVLICEFPTDLTVVIEKQPWSCYCKKHTSIDVCTYECACMFITKSGIFFLFLVFVVLLIVLLSFLSMFSLIFGAHRQNHGCFTTTHSIPFHLWARWIVFMILTDSRHRTWANICLAWFIRCETEGNSFLFVAFFGPFAFLSR